MTGETLAIIPARLRFARYVSAATQPPLTVVPVLGIFNGVGVPGVTLAWWLLWCAVTITFTSTAPSLIFVALLRRRTIGDLYVSNRAERPLAYGLMVALYLIAAELARLTSAPRTTVALLIAGTISLLIAALVNATLCKISVHTVSTAAGSVALIATYGAALLPVLALPMLVGWARVTLRAHTRAETVLGACVGAAVATLVFALF